MMISIGMHPILTLLFILPTLTIISSKPCEICPKKSNILSPDSTLEWKGYNMTCAAAQIYALNLVGRSQCDSFLDYAKEKCSCIRDNDRVCNMCPNGEDPILESAECELIQVNLLWAKGKSIECSVAQSQAKEENCCLSGKQSHIPGDLQSEWNACSLCSDGAQPQVDMSHILYNDVTCNDLQASGSLIHSDSDECSLLQAQGVRLCGCPNERLRKCNICAGNDEDVGPPHPDMIISDSNTGENITCQDLHHSVIESSSDCAAVQAKGYFHCGCKNPPDLLMSPCSLCYNNPNGTFPKLDAMGYPSKHCSDMAADMYALGDGTKECLWHQAKAVLECGCDSIPPQPLRPSCTLCPGGLQPNHLDYETSLGVACGTLNQLIPTLFRDHSCKAEELTSFREVCSCPETAKCELCQGMDPLVDTNKVVTGRNQKNISCGDLALSANKIMFKDDIRDFQAQCSSLQTDFASLCCVEGSKVSTSIPTLMPSVEGSRNKPIAMKEVMSSFKRTLLGYWSLVLSAIVLITC